MDTPASDRWRSAEVSSKDPQGKQGVLVWLNKLRLRGPAGHTASPRHTQMENMGEEATHRQNQRLEGCGHKPRVPRMVGSPKTGRGEEGFFPRASQRGRGPADIWVLDFQPPGL